jgi:hypothetical protein
MLKTLWETTVKDERRKNGKSVTGKRINKLKLNQFKNTRLVEKQTNERPTRGGGVIHWEGKGWEKERRGVIVIWYENLVVRNVF